MSVVSAILFIIFIKCVLLYRVYNKLPLNELKRRARAKDNRQAKSIYRVAAFEGSLDILLWIAGTASLTASVIIAAQLSWWLSALVMVLAAWILFWAPHPRDGGWFWAVTSWGSGYMYKLVSLLNPVLSFLARTRPPALSVHFHTGLYEKEDLLELLKAQNHQIDSRIPQSELKIAAGALTFGEKTVSSVMTPRRMVRFVSEDELVGPTLMDELYKTGFSRFPVVKGPAKSASPQIIGTLYLRDIVEIGQDNKGKVRDHMKKDVAFINEACTLHQALDAFLKSRHHLLVVVNNFEEIVGLLSLEDVLEQIIGVKIMDEFDKYQDLRAVAGLQAGRQQAEHKEVKASEPAETVVE